MTFLERTVNGQPGLVAQQDGAIVTVFAFDVAGDRIKRIWVIRNPDKLRTWYRPLCLTTQARQGSGSHGARGWRDRR
jgi:hypothetical protein